MVKMEPTENALAPSTGERVRLIINVEAQREFRPGYPLIKRGVYYGSRMISAQYGTVFTNAHYEKLRKVYSVWICLSPPEMWQNTITAYQFREKNVLGEAHEVQENYDLIHVIVVGLTIPENTEDGSLIQMLSVLLSVEMSAKEKKKILEETEENIAPYYRLAKENPDCTAEELVKLMQ